MKTDARTLYVVETEENTHVVFGIVARSDSFFSFSLSVDYRRTLNVVVTKVEETDSEILLTEENSHTLKVYPLTEDNYNTVKNSLIGQYSWKDFISIAHKRGFKLVEEST
ncbi:hypothetical protein C4561_01820 [candidate division WWE3 bacterium]|uniref:Uncharacterized protein n=1 Tax=candidate division WWE3 bacterium TaxID=2053526 RepID=A0A3A4ZLA9_UNCKA|nr:MAG: hypothetical protein C4561_01820 [candidate division WWE3 bacterium]